MRVVTFLFSLALVSAITLGGCASNKDKDELTSEQQVYQMAQKALDANNWEAAITALRLLEENFPFGAYGEQAQLELIYAHYRSKDFDSVIAAADRFIRLHPQHRNVDYAYYMRGLASFSRESGFLGSLFGTDNTNRDPGAARESFSHFAQLIQRFPNSPYAVDAQQRMIYLRNVLARYEIHVANYYFKRGAYLAAANRGRYVVENFQQTPAVPDALAVMAHGYYLLGMEELAEDSVAVLAANFPEHPALDDDGNFNREYTSRPGDRSWIGYLTFGLFEKREPQGFDTRERYDPQHTGTSEPPSFGE